MVPGNFKDLYSQLNSAQKKAVKLIEGAVMVVAGPGTGKTQVLTLRIANILLKADINPENILALTFTESAALNMRNRLVEIIGTPGFRVNITTFHSFCNEVIKSHPEDFPHLISSESITELEQIEMVERILAKGEFNLLVPFGDPVYYVRSIVKQIDELKKEGVTVEIFTEGLDKQRQDFEKTPDLYHDKGRYKGEMKGKYQELRREMDKNAELIRVYEQYQKMLFEEKGYDFNDMLLEVLQVLQKNRGLLLSLQERYQYVLVDEHQDTNTAQNRIIELLCSFYENPNLFVVGDEKQAIFRFQGASLENFIYFKSLYPEAVLISLTDNYRSNQTLLDGAGSLISQNSMANVLLPEAAGLVARTSLVNELIKIAKINDYYGEYHFVADEIEKRIAEGVSLSEIAVIGRNNRDLLPLSEVLESRGIVYSLESDSNIFADPQVKKLILLFKAIANFGDDGVLISALHIDCLGCEVLDVFRVMRYAQKNKVSIIDIITNNQLLAQLNLENLKAFSDFYQKLKNWEQVSVNDGFENLFVEVLNSSGLIKWVLKQPNSIEVLDKFTGLFEDIKLQVQRKPDFSLQDFINYLELLEKHQVMIKKSARTIFSDAVRLLTAHKSKGLEFDFVYIINAFDGHWGNPRKRGGAFKIPWEYVGVKLKLGVELDENEDERRLFYVALTRARRIVTVTYSTKGLDGKDQVPSQFIGEIQESCRGDLDCSEFETRFLSHKEVIFAPKVVRQSQITVKEFLNSIFLDRGLSITAISNYLQCPWKYFYRNLLLLPDVKTKSLIFGSAIHKALSLYLKSLPSRMPSLEFLLKSYEQALLKEVINEKDFKELVEKGGKVLKGYFEETAKEWKSDFMSELYVKGVKIEDKLYINGMIDMVEPLRRQGPGGQASFEEVRVYDFKTGRVKSRAQISGESNGEYNYDYRRQLVFYKILLERYGYESPRGSSSVKNKKMKVVEGVIDFIEPDSKGKYKREVFDISETEVDELLDLTRRVGKEIWELDFWERRCGDKTCEYCDLADMIIRQNGQVLVKPLRSQGSGGQANFEEVDLDFASLVSNGTGDLTVKPVN